MFSFLPRFVSALAIVTILAAHFISMAEHKEVFAVCAVSYFIRIVHILGMGGSYLLEALGLLLIIFCWLFIVIMGLCLILTLILSAMIVITGESHRVLLRLACIVHYAIGLLIFVGLCLIIANQSLPNFQGVDKIEVSSIYFFVPAILVVCGGYFHAHWRMGYPAVVEEIR